MINTAKAKKRAIELKGLGNDYVTIATLLNQEGYKTKLDKLFTHGNVWYLLSFKAREKSKNKTIHTVDQPRIKAIRALCDCDMNEGDKIALIELILERGAKQ